MPPSRFTVGFPTADDRLALVIATGFKYGGAQPERRARLGHEGGFTCEERLYD